MAFDYVIVSSHFFPFSIFVVNKQKCVSSIIISDVLHHNQSPPSSDCSITRLFSLLFLLFWGIVIDMHSFIMLILKMVQTSDLHTFLVFLLWDKVNISRFVLAKVKLWTHLTHEMRHSPSTTLQKRPALTAIILIKGR